MPPSKKMLPPRRSARQSQPFISSDQLQLLPMDQLVGCAVTIHFLGPTSMGRDERPYLEPSCMHNASIYPGDVTASSHIRSCTMGVAAGSTLLHYAIALFLSGELLAHLLYPRMDGGSMTANCFDRVHVGHRRLPPCNISSITAVLSAVAWDINIVFVTHATKKFNLYVSAATLCFLSACMAMPPWRLSPRMGLSGC